MRLSMRIIAIKIIIRSSMVIHIHRTLSIIIISLLAKLIKIEDNEQLKEHMFLVFGCLLSILDFWSVFLYVASFPS